MKISCQKIYRSEIYLFYKALIFQSKVSSYSYEKALDMETKLLDFSFLCQVLKQMQLGVNFPYFASSISYLIDLKQIAEQLESLVQLI